mgnify:CR=1 FL=1
MRGLLLDLPPSLHASATLMTLSRKPLTSGNVIEVAVVVAADVDVVVATMVVVVATMVDVVKQLAAKILIHSQMQ